MIRRHLAEKVLTLTWQFPVVSITGPRQSGKTTLARMTFGDYAYVNLEEPDEREFAVDDPRWFLRRFVGGVVLDEIRGRPISCPTSKGSSTPTKPPDGSSSPTPTSSI